MTGYYVVRSGKLFDSYIKNVSASAKMDAAYQLICKEFGIKSSKYGQETNILIILPTTEDEAAFGAQMKAYNGSTKAFKKTSDVHLRWINLCKERELEAPSRMRLIDFFPVQGPTATSMIPIDGVLYCSYKTDCDFNDMDGFVLPDGFEEIKASEYYKALEDYTERVKASNNVV